MVGSGYLVLQMARNGAHADIPVWADYTILSLLTLAAVGAVVTAFVAFYQWYKTK
jgi:hypothetical protein